MTDFFVWLDQEAPRWMRVWWMLVSVAGHIFLIMAFGTVGVWIIVVMLFIVIPAIKIIEAYLCHTKETSGAEARLAKALETMERIDRAITYPVSTEINANGYEVRPPSKDLLKLVAGMARIASAELKGGDA